MSASNDFYEDDEPVGAIVEAFEHGEKLMTQEPCRGFTSYLDPLCGYLSSAGFLSPGGTTEASGNTSAPAC